MVRTKVAAQKARGAKRDEAQARTTRGAGAKRKASQDDDYDPPAATKPATAAATAAAAGGAARKRGRQAAGSSSHDTIDLTDDTEPADEDDDTAGAQAPRKRAKVEKAAGTTTAAAAARAKAKKPQSAAVAPPLALPPAAAAAGATVEDPVEALLSAGQQGNAGSVTVEQLKAHLKSVGMPTTGRKAELIERARDHRATTALATTGDPLLDFPRSCFNIDCVGDVCRRDIVLFCQEVFGEYDHHARSGKAIGTRDIAGRVIKDSYGVEKQQHTFTLQVLWSCGKDAKCPGETMMIKGRNLYARVKGMAVRRRRWDDEASRVAVLDEKHERGAEARGVRDARIGKKAARNDRYFASMAHVFDPCNNRDYESDGPHSDDYPESSGNESEEWEPGAHDDGTRGWRGAGQGAVQGRGGAAHAAGAVAAAGAAAAAAVVAVPRPACHRLACAAPRCINAGARACGHGLCGSCCTGCSVHKKKAKGKKAKRKGKPPAQARAQAQPAALPPAQWQAFSTSVAANDAQGTATAALTLDPRAPAWQQQQPRTQTQKQWASTEELWPHAAQQPAQAEEVRVQRASEERLRAQAEQLRAQQQAHAEQLSAQQAREEQRVWQEQEARAKHQAHAEQLSAQQAREEQRAWQEQEARAQAEARARAQQQAHAEHLSAQQAREEQRVWQEQEARAQAEAQARAHRAWEQAQGQARAQAQAQARAQQVWEAQQARAQAATQTRAEAQSQQTRAQQERFRGRALSIVRGEEHSATQHAAWAAQADARAAARSPLRELPTGGGNPYAWGGGLQVQQQQRQCGVRCATRGCAQLSASQCPSRLCGSCCTTCAVHARQARQARQRQRVAQQ